MRPLPRRLTLAAVLATALASCGGGAREELTVVTPPVTTPAPPDAAAEADSPPSLDADLSEIARTRERAIHVALDTVGGGLVTEIEPDTDDGTWEIEVRARGGRQYDVDVAAMQGRVLAVERGSTAGDEDPRRALVPRQQAERTATAKVDDSVVLGVELDDELGTLVWQVVVIDPDRTAREFSVDARTGKVLDSEVDG